MYAKSCTQTTGSRDSKNSKNCSDLVADKTLVNSILPRTCEDFHYFRKPCFLCRICTRQNENLQPFTNMVIYFWKLLINYENGKVFLKYQRAEKHLISTSTTFIKKISVQTIVKYFFCVKPSGLILPWLKSGTGRSSSSLVLISKALISYTCFAPPPNLFFWTNSYFTDAYYRGSLEIHNIITNSN